MPRRERHYIAGQPYHIVQRGNNREACFIELENYQFYLKLWQELSKKYKLIIMCKYIGFPMNKFIVIFLIFFSSITFALESEDSIHNLTDPVFAFDISENGKIEELPEIYTKKIFPDEVRSKYFKNIRMWIFSDVTAENGYRYLIIDGMHPIAPEGTWYGDVEQLGGYFVVIKNEEIKKVTTVDKIFSEDLSKIKDDIGCVTGDVVNELARDYVIKLIVFLGGVENTKNKISKLCDMLLKKFMTSSYLENELIKSSLISKDRIDQIHSLKIPDNHIGGCRAK